MIHIILDTTVLRSDPARKKAAFESLKRLAIARELRIYMPYIVKREFLSQEEASYSKYLDSLLTNVKELKRKPLPGEIKAALEKIEAELEVNETTIKLKQFAEDEFFSWCQETNTEILPIDGGHAQRVIDSYFEGKAPFKSKKNRADFPDAFIFEAILELNKKTDKIYVVTNDDGLSKAFENHENIISVKDLDKLISLDIYQDKIKNIEKQEKIEFIGELITKSSFIEDKIKGILEKELPGTTVISSEIPDDNNEATIDSIEDIIEVDANQNVNYYGNDTFVFDFEAQVKCNLSYFVFKSDYWCLDDEKLEKVYIFDSDWNDHYYAVEESYLIQVSGLVSVELAESDIFESSELSEDDLLNTLEESSVNLESSLEISTLSS